MRDAIRLRHYSRRTEEAYCYWVRRFLCYYRGRNPAHLDAAQVRTFLSDLATRRRVTASTQNQAFNAVIFLYRHVLRLEMSGLEDVVRAKPATHVPLVLSKEEVAAVLGRLQGAPWLMASLMYGAGLRLMECAASASRTSTSPIASSWSATAKVAKTA